MADHDKDVVNKSDKLYQKAIEVGFSQFCVILLRTISTMPLAWLVIYAVSYSYAPAKSFFAWISFFSIHWIFSLFVLHRVKANGPELTKHRSIVILIVFLDGVLWGAMFYALMGYSAVLDSWIVTLLAGIISVSIPCYISFPRAFYVFLFSMWLSATLSVIAIIDRVDLAWKLVFTMLVYSLVLVYMLKPIAYRMIDTIYLQLVNQALANQLQRTLKDVSHQANTDALTGMLNRHALNSSLSELIVKGERRRSPFSLLMIDIDFFKDVNDTYGHDVGDKAIQHVALCIADQLRDDDLCFRFGGEEFVVLLPNTNTTEAVYVAERIRKAVEDTPLQDPEHPMTISIGVATHQYGMTAEMLLKAADDEVYVAKANGRNRISISETNVFYTLPKVK